MRPDQIHLPPSQGHTVKVSVINGSKSHMPAEMLVQATFEKQKYLSLTSYSFLIESANRDKKVLFDLAFMKALNDRMPPFLKALFAGAEDVGGIDETHDIPDTLSAHGIDLAVVDAVIWSHAHIDHVGDPSVFPPSTDLLVGPGFEAAYMPGYPTNQDATVLDSAFEGRTVRELDFSVSSTVQIGGFRAVDYFDDSSFYLLEAPGHTAHHLCALARTTADTWILMGGDACHNAAQIRPSEFRRLPESVPASILGRVPSSGHCSCAHLAHRIQQDSGGSFYGINADMQENMTEAEDTARKLRTFDGRDDVFVIIAHDSTVLEVVDVFPSHLNGWKAQGWADQSRWLFLRDVEH